MRPTPKTDRRRRRAWIVAVVAVVLATLFGTVALRHFTNPEFLEKQLAAAVGPDYRVDIGATMFNPLRRRFVATEISIVPDTTSQTVREGRLRVRYSFTASDIRISGVDLWALYKGRVAIASIQIDAPRAEMYKDHTIPGTQEQQSATFPHQVLRDVERPIRIDTIRVTDGDLVYAERASDGSRPGRFRFTDFSAVVNNVTNDSIRVRTSCSIDVQTKLADEGQLDASFDYDFTKEKLNMEYRGTISRMSGSALNDILVDLEGIRVTGGTIDTTSFVVQVQDDVATGTVRVLYRDITFEMLDKETLEKGLADRVGTLVYRAKSRESNPEDDEHPPIEMEIVRPRDPDDSLIRFVWETVREGLLRTLGVQS